MGGDAAGQDGDVVAPLEHAHDPPAGVRLGDRDDLLGQDLEVLDFQAQVADRVLGVGVEARADQDQLGPDAVGQVLEARAERGVILGPRRAVGQGDVQRSSPGPCPVPVSSRAPVPG